MGKIYYRGNLSSAIYPMTLAQAGRSVVMPGPDQNFDRRVDPAGEQKDAGIPQAIYMENVVPTVSGYQSVGYLQPKIAPVLAPGVSILDVLELDVKVGSNFFKGKLFSLSTGTSYLCGDLATGTVTVVGTSPGGNLASNATTAVVNDVAYLFAQEKLYTVTGTIFNTDVVTITLTEVTASVTPAGFLGTANIIAIAGSSNYLICTDGVFIYYSSLTTSTDFVSSLISGAGAIRPNDIKGTIAKLIETPNGFYILASQSTVLAKYTGNNRYPWKFTPVKNVTAYLGRPGALYGNITTKGYYAVDTNNHIKFLSDALAENIGAEVSEFLSNNVVQNVFDYDTNTFTEARINTTEAKIYTLNERYIFVSINNNNNNSLYEDVLVYDILLKRYGKLKIQHSFIYEIIAEKTGPTAPDFGNKRTTVAFITNNRTDPIRVLSFGPYDIVLSYNNYNALTQRSVLVLGKFQYARSRFIKLEELEIEGTKTNSLPGVTNFAAVLIPCLDGYTFNQARPLIYSYFSQSLVKYPVHVTAQNHSLILKGAFDVSTIQLAFVNAGER